MSINRIGTSSLYGKKLHEYNYKTQTQNSVSNPFFNTQPTQDTFHYQNTTSTQEEVVNTLELREELKETKSKQGLLGKVWDGFKNLTGIGAGSEKAEKAIEDYENGIITKEEMEKAVNGYKEGQKMVVDVVADIASGILAVGAFALAVPTGGASLGIGLAIAGTVGAGVKIGIKAGDALATGKEYNGKDLLYDFATGAVNGLLAPVTNGIGNSVTKTIGKKFGLTILKEGAEELAEQGVKQGVKLGFKSMVLNQATDVIGGTIGKRALALGAGMAVDGALGGASDNMVRAALNGENVIKAGFEGAIGGAIMSPIIGGGFRVAGKAGRALNNKITMSKVLPDGMSTKFKQGTTGDCALLSTIDGMMSNPNTSSKIKKAITKTAFGDYNVKIGDRIVRVSKSALSDEILSDTTGIKLFEAAYKQMGGSIDGEFAEVVAKQFGLNPIHITSEALTDEMLEKISKKTDDLVLSLGMDGHYYSVKNIDPKTKMVTVVDPYDTSKTLQKSFDDIRAKGATLDGGSIKGTDLPNVGRNADEIGPRGKKELTLEEILEELKLSNKDKKATTFALKRMNVGETYTGKRIPIKKLGENLYELDIPEILNEFNKMDEPELLNFLLSNIKLGDTEFQKTTNSSFKQLLKSLWLTGQLDKNTMIEMANAFKRRDALEDMNIRAALKNYKTKAYRSMNKALRGESIAEFTPKDMSYTEYCGVVKRDISKLKSFLDSFTIERPLRLFRRDKYSIFDDIKIDTDLLGGKKLADAMNEASRSCNPESIEKIRKALTNKSFTQKSFLSTSFASIGSDACERNAVAPIQWHFTTKGVKGCYIDAFGDTLLNECEFLLQAGSHITINDVKFQNNNWIIDAIITSQ